MLVDRLWPRGVAKAALDYNEWAKDLAPSTALRVWFGHDPARFAEFSRRYRDELATTATEALARLRGRSSLVLLTATRDIEHSGATVLRAVLEGEHREDGASH